MDRPPDLTGQQADAYADHFIAVHVTNMSGGKTYSQLSAAALAQPANTKLAALVNTVFKGESLRGMLLNAYGWWKAAQIMYIAALISFALAGLVLIGSGIAIVRGRRVSPEAEIFPTRAQHAKAA